MTKADFEAFTTALMAKIAASPVPAKPASPEEQFATTVTAVRKMTIDSALDKAKLVDPGIR